MGAPDAPVGQSLLWRARITSAAGVAPGPAQGFTCRELALCTALSARTWACLSIEIPVEIDLVRISVSLGQTLTQTVTGRLEQHSRNCPAVSGLKYSEISHIMCHFNLQTVRHSRRNESQETKIGLLEFIWRV